jgi:UDPglucose 6-dehydrogenase
LAGRSIAVWGLAFKGGTDDLRDSPSHTLIADLVDAGAVVRAYDPAAGESARRHYADEGDVEIVSSLLETLDGADALAITADWPEFRSVQLAVIASALKERIVVDGRNLFSPMDAAAAGLTYSAIGRGDN